MADGGDAPDDVSRVLIDLKKICLILFQSIFDLTKKKKKKKPKDDLTSAEKEGDENASNEQATIIKEKKSKSVAFAAESSEVKIVYDIY